LLVGQDPGRFHEIGLGDLALRIHDALGELCVVGEDQQSAGFEIETAHGNHILGDTFEQIVDSWPAFRVFVSGEIAFRLVQQ
jgi:hypothetical protein